MTGILRKALALSRYLRSRAFGVAVLTVVLALTVYLATEMTLVVQIREGNDVQTYYTMNDNPREILKQYGYVTMAYDAVDFTGFHNKLGRISISRAFPVELRCDGETSVLMVTGGTVADVLDMADITLGDQDIVDLPADRMVEEDDVVTVTRQKLVTRREEIPLPYESVTVASPAVEPGDRGIVVQGETGLRVDTYAQMVINGVREEEYLLGRDVVRTPVNHKAAVGFPSRAVSGLDFEAPFDENGEPASYRAVLRGMRAAGYSAPAGARTASGRAAMVGHVAVNPHVIPYGTRLYIQSPGGGFVYGYAVAADTGTALAQGVIDVDLFYSTYAESAANGIRTVDIYVLE